MEKEIFVIIVGYVIVLDLGVYLDLGLIGVLFVYLD